ncbi:threonine/serine exporter family protein [Staphylococcus agnetis]|uniref:threonine/serine exporter family protein n=1 Tax=Staphylococcus agnetis TaxID=985762 RepID=UPI000D1B2DC8|nr:threonine/serine exporter family protein [Staphylococcus agnetis]MCO4338394.1 threonine/serine exporter family protein [Staphylococcus agnetis]MCO4341743.1 threonine/serine exporter family protein [Staphylococcus agnetis]MCO4342877.1 threonine/serine exporter family protein [Staphylococcus agnetis]MCO4345490.1 threonine/serine exporter family protein [Staphylococcus agnetis]MCO4348805.1 threonine/serine exporter family protein [Staphylococcus agnetis]
MADSLTIIDENKVIDVVLLAGKVLLESGAETYRVEDTMGRIAASFGLEDTYAFVTSTAIMFSLNDRTNTRLVRVRERTTDLEKIAIANNVSRKISQNQLTLDQAKSELIHLEHASLQYSFILKFISAAIASGFFLFMFGGVAHDFIYAVIAGAGAFLTFDLVQRYIQIKFFSEFISSMVVITVAASFTKLGMTVNQDIITIAGVMPLVPGILITNAIRDLMAGELLAGMSRGVEAALTAFAIGAGVAVVLIIF